MTDENNHPLVPYRSSAIEKDGAGARGILSTVVSDALVLAQKNSLGNTRFRIGDHYLREPDFRQIQRWAEALELEPAEVIRRLEEKGRRTTYGDSLVPWWRKRGFDTDTRFEDGAIVSLAWNFDLLPLAEFTWEDDLHIQQAIFQEKMPVGAHLFINLPTLTALKCLGML